MAPHPYLVSLAPALAFAALFPSAEVPGMIWYAVPMELPLSIAAFAWAALVPRGWVVSVLFGFTSATFRLLGPASDCNDLASCREPWMRGSSYFLLVCGVVAAVGALVRFGFDSVRRKRVPKSV